MAPARPPDRRADRSSSRSASPISSGYTELAEGLDEHELSDLLARFETLAYDTVAASNGRIVKTIGDEVMFVGMPATVATIALALAERVAADPIVPDVRIGVAYGSLLARDGDFYGPVVNLASRITGRGPAAATVLASEPLRESSRTTRRSCGARSAASGFGASATSRSYVLRRAR